MRDFVNSFSKNEVLPLQLRYLSNIGCEIICTEWLRSPLSGAAQIKFQYLKTGGNLRDIDIYGFSLRNEELIAQVTSSNDQNLINKKIEKLIEYKEIPIKIMFCQSLQESNRGNCQIIHIEKVFNDLLQNGYEMLIKKLIQG
jgi:hypothetical protein